VKTFLAVLFLISASLLLVPKANASDAVACTLGTVTATTQQWSCYSQWISSGNIASKWIDPTGNGEATAGTPQVYACGPSTACIWVTVTCDRTNSRLAPQINPSTGMFQSVSYSYWLHELMTYAGNNYEIKGHFTCTGPDPVTTAMSPVPSSPYRNVSVWAPNLSAWVLCQLNWDDGGYCDQYYFSPYWEVSFIP